MVKGIIISTKKTPMVVKTIPKNSLYFSFVDKAIKLHNQHSNWRDARGEIIKYWKETRDELIKQSKDSKRLNMLQDKYLHGVHVLPNIGIIILALLYGDGDLGKSICIAGMAGYDTDCNCGNVGAIIGTSIGESKIAKKWKDPINNIFKTKLRSLNETKISDIAKRICKIGKEVVQAKD